MVASCVFKDDVDESTTYHQKNAGWYNNLEHLEKIEECRVHDTNHKGFNHNSLNWSLHLLSVYIIKMSKTPIIIGVLALMVCSSSSAAMLMMGGDDEKTTTLTGPGPSSPGPTSPGPTIPAPTDTCVGGTVCPSKLTSPSGACIAKFLDDGSYVVYDGTGAIIWSSDTRNMGTGPYRTTMQGDGNFVLYDSTDTALWNSTTAGRGTGPYRAVMQDDCNLVVYGSGDQPTWSSIGGIVS